MLTEPIALHALNTLPGVGAVTLRLLLAHFGSATAAWDADPQDWAAVPDIGPKTCAAFAAGRLAFQESDARVTLEREGIAIIGYLDAEYPALLRETPSPPAILYVRGPYRAWNIDTLVAVVGSREFTQYGKQAAESLSHALAAAGVTIVSGLAFGIDSLAHTSTLDAHGKTVAVIGSGIDSKSLSPQSHRRLAEEIIAGGGALLSEFAPGTPATPGTFPARNRIMAGMSQATLVIEAKPDSGSLITARLALDYNRDLFAVPGSIFSENSLGTNTLIAAGAVPATSAADLLSLIAPPGRQLEERLQTAITATGLQPDAAKLLALLSHEPLHVDRIVRASRLETLRVNAILTELELLGFAQNIGNMHYIKCTV